MSSSYNIVNGKFFLNLFKNYIKNDPGRVNIVNTIDLKYPIKFDIFLIKFKSELIHIGSGSYADVFRSHGFIFKFIRLLPEAILNRIHTPTISRTTSYIDSFNEYQIAHALSKLNRNSFTFQDRQYFCSIFPKIYCTFLSKEDISSYLKVSKQSLTGDDHGYWDIFDDYLLNIPRENLVIVMEDCGELMVDMVATLQPRTCISILKQIITGLMIAEIYLEFEHRDLHSGNILLKPCKDNLIQFRTEKNIITIPSLGYQVKIIDNTFSRLKYKNIVYYKDMTSLFENFEERYLNEKLVKKQNDIYYRMHQIINNDWQGFYPRTNVLWIKYVIYKLLKSLSMENNQTEHFHEMIRVKNILEIFNKQIDFQSSCSECFTQIINQPLLNTDVVIQIIKN